MRASARAATRAQMTTASLAATTSARRAPLALASCSRGLRHARQLSTASAAQPDEALSPSFAADPFSPSEEHRALREMVASFTEAEVEPQALEYNRAERFNHDLFRRCGELGLLGVTVDPEYGGSGMDALAACIVHEELSASDPAFCLSYLAHSQLFVNNLMRNGSHEQKSRLLPAACSGELVFGAPPPSPRAASHPHASAAVAPPPSPAPPSSPPRRAARRQRATTTHAPPPSRRLAVWACPSPARGPTSSGWAREPTSSRMARLC